MSKKSKHIISDSQEFIKYTGNEMSNSERNTFEKKLQSDSFEYEAAEGYSNIKAGELKEDLAYLSSEVKKRIIKRKTIYWYRIAASVAILSIVSAIFFTHIRNKIDKGSGMLITSESITSMDEEKSTAQQISIPEEIRPSVLISEKIEEKQGVLISDEISKQKSKSLKKITTDLNEMVDNEKQQINNEIKTAALKEPDRELTKTALDYGDYDSSRNFQMKSEVENVSGKSREPKTVRGIILSYQDSAPLPGVSIISKETGIVAISDIRGEFLIPVPEDSSLHLIARHPYLEEKEIQVKDSQLIRIEMEQNTHSDQMIAAAAYPNEKKFRLIVKEGRETQHKSVYFPPLPFNGYNGFNDYILKNQKYPSQMDVDKAIVILNFLVELDGRPDSIIIIKSPGDEFSREALRLLQEGPDWIPARRDGKNVVDGVQVKMEFSLKEE